MTRVSDRLRQVLVVGRIGGLRELHIDRDLPGTVLDEVVDHPRVVATRERKLRLEAVVSLDVFVLRARQRRRVDTDDHEVLDQRGLRAANLEAGVDRLQLRAMEDPRRVGEHVQPAGERGHTGEHHPDPPTPRAATQAGCPPVLVRDGQSRRGCYS